jgi:hypothetical protein
MQDFESPKIKLKLTEPEKFGNVAEQLSENERHDIATFVTDLVKIDEGSMSDWLGKADGYLQKVNADTNTSAPANNNQEGSNEKGPPSTSLMMSAAIQFTARITGSILSEPELAKASEPGGELLAKWISSQLRTVDPDWVTDTDPLTLHMAVTGLAWRKRWFDEHDDIFRSTWLPSTRGEGKPGVIINANAKSIERAPRITHPIEKYPYEIKRSIELKHWIDYDPRFDEIDPEELQQFYETDIWLDVDGDGYDEPWTVTIALDDTPTIVKMTPRWSRKSVTDTDELLLFRPVRRFYAYRMIPDPTGKFFPHGFGWLLERAEATADNLLASIDDTAKSQSQNGGIASIGGIGVPEKIALDGDRITTIPADGKNIGDVLSILPAKQVTPGQVQILDKVITLADRLAGTLNVLENAPASMTATLAKGIIDSGTQVQGAVTRRIIGEMTEEMRAFARLADDHDELPEGVAGSGPIAVTADPNMATELQRSAAAQIYHEMLQMPMIFDPQEVGRRFAEVLRLPNPEKLVKLMGKPQPTDMERADMQIKADKNANERMKIRAGALLQISNAVLALSQAGVNAQNAELLKVEIAKLNAAVDELAQDDASSPNGNGPAGSAPGANGAAQLPSQAPGPSGGGMAQGNPTDGGNAGPGGGTGIDAQPSLAAG